MRRINVKPLFCSLGCLALLGAGTALAHYLQSGRIAQALLGQADRAENQEHLEEAVRFLGRYLEFVPEDTDQRARLGRLLVSDRMIRSNGQSQRVLVPSHSREGDGSFPATRSGGAEADGGVRKPGRQ